MADRPYPNFSRAERIADGTVHAIGVSLAVCGAAVLVVFASLGGDLRIVTAASVYAAALVLCFLSSACYHMTPWERLRPLFRRIDHAAIYIVIAGTYTPFVVLLDTPLAWTILAAVWILALCGAAAKLWFWTDPGHAATLLYLALGWLSVVILWPLVDRLPPLATGLLILGGLLYSAGVIFFAWERLRFNIAIWHGFVLLASACFYAAIALGTLAPVQA